MPTYDYHCAENGRTVEVFHGIRAALSTWGEICELAGIPPGDTPPGTPVERQIGAGLAAPREAPYAPYGGPAAGGPATGGSLGCCGGSCH